MEVLRFCRFQKFETVVSPFRVSSFDRKDHRLHLDTQDAGHKAQGTVQDTRHRQDAGHRVQNTVHTTQDTGCRTKDTGQTLDARHRKQGRAEDRVRQNTAVSAVVLCGVAALWFCLRLFFTSSRVAAYLVTRVTTASPFVTETIPGVKYSGSAESTIRQK